MRQFAGFSIAVLPRSNVSPGSTSWSNADFRRARRRAVPSKAARVKTHTYPPSGELVSRHGTDNAISPRAEGVGRAFACFK